MSISKPTPTLGSPRDLDRELTALRGLPELAGLTDGRLQALLLQFDEIVVAPEVEIQRAGRPAAQYVVLLEGALRQSGPDGTRLLGPGASAGWSSMWEGGAAGSTVATAARSRLLVMSRAQFRAVRALPLNGSGGDLVGLRESAQQPERQGAGGSLGHLA